MLTPSWQQTLFGRRRTGRYITLLILIAALFGGWSWLWYYAAGKAEATIDGWRAREAKDGRDLCLRVADASAAIRSASR